MLRTPLLIAVLSSSLLACGSSRSAETEEPGPTPALTTSGEEAPDAAKATEDPTPPASGEMKDGTIVYEEIPPTKSVRAYTGAELFLDMGGDRVTLRPTDAVGRDRLLGLAGKRVRVRVEWTAGHPPAPGSSAPLGMNGEPLPQGAGWRVLAVEAL